MSFLYPGFLWALFALAIPIAIHIFNFRRTKRIYFSNVQLLKEVKTETNSFRRLKHLLILLSRLAFLTFLILAFAQPYFPSENQKAIKNLSGLVSVYVDNSYSMQSELGNESYLDLASVYTTDLIRVFPKDARFQLITNNFENQEQYPVSAAEIEDRLTETTYGNTYRDLGTVYERQFNLLNRHSGGAKNQVFWFSDFQKSTSGELTQLELDTLNQYYIVPIRSERTPNLMIDSVWLENPFIKSLETNQVKVRLTSFNEESYQGLTLKLFIDDKQVSTTTLDLEPRASMVAEINFTVQGSGIKPCKITFEDFPVTFDNEYYFVINASPKVNILHLYENKKVNYVENVYGNESVFEVNSFSVNNLDYNRIQSAELIILNEVSSVEGELSTGLTDFVRRGGNLVIFPATQPSPSFTRFLNSISVSGFQSEKPDSLGTGKANELALLNAQNPFYQGIFERVPNNMNMPYANAVSRWNNIGDNLLLFKNRQPYLTRFNAQKGKVYLFASPLETDYSNLAKHAIFVPIMYKIASLSKSAAGKLAYTFQDQTIRTQVSKLATNQVYRLVRDDLELVPTQRIVEEELVFELPEQVLEAGFYELKIDNQTEGLLAFNYGKAESEMDFYSMNEIKGALGGKPNVQIYDFNESKNFIQEFEQKNIQLNLWKYMLILALLFLLAEVLLIRFL